MITATLNTSVAAAAFAVEVKYETWLEPGHKNFNRMWRWEKLRIKRLHLLGGYFGTAR